MSGIRPLAGLCCALICLIQCGNGTQARVQTIVAQPLAESSPLAGPRFSEIPPEESGLNFVNQLKPEHHKRYLENGSGVAIADVDGNGLPDVYLLSIDGPNKLFLQLEPFQFADHTEAAGLGGINAWSTGASFADIDNDGDQDLFVCHLRAPNQLFLNDGKGIFRENSAAAGLDHSGASYIGAFADYDRDGDLDLYLLTNRVFSVTEEVGGNAKIRMVDGRPTVHPDFLDQYFLIGNRVSQAGQADILYQNNGDGTFTDVSKAAGIRGYDMGLSVTWWDYNNDGWPDLYIANDMKTPDHLWKNNGDGTFSEAIETVTRHTPWFSMGADSADINGDGFFDLLVADMSSTTHFKEKTTMGEMGNANWFLTSAKPRQYMRNALFLNSGREKWADIAFLAGLASTDWTWSVKFGDMDNDGHTDVFFTNGTARNVNDSDWNAYSAQLRQQGQLAKEQELALKLPALAEKNLSFKNLGNLRFENTTDAWGLGKQGVSHGAAFADLDRDGDLDLIVNNLKEPVSLYRNNSSGGNRILLSLKGTTSNRGGYGAVVKLTCNGHNQTQQLFPVRGYLSANEPILHFGLGNAREVGRLEIQWPSGLVQTFEKLAANFHYTVTEAGEEMPRQKTGTPLFTAAAPFQFNHRSEPFDDYQNEPLLPHKLSELGPGIAVSDVNGDERDDLFIGGGAGQAGQLFLSQANQTAYRPVDGPWQNFKAASDMGILFFDADGDGDDDLLTVSGGNHLAANDPALRHRLYLNDGRGNFSTPPEARLPAAGYSGSSALSCDFDRDGDLDLFIGGRLIGGNYPQAPPSRLYRNDGDTFTDITQPAAPMLSQAGMVTAAVFSDFQGDGWQDLLLVREWGAPMLLANREGLFEDISDQAGLAEYTGWWTSLTSGDVDGDGDMDFVAGNMGLNTKYKADKDHPFQLYFKDFDQSGSVDLVETKWENDTQFPVRGLSCSSNAMPFIREKFPSFNKFATASLSEIFEQDLGEAGVLEAVTLASAVFINEGTRFRRVELPPAAQAAPAFGLGLADFNADGHLDLAMAQNFFSPQPETGFMDGGLSLILTGGTHFTAMAPSASGIVNQNDAKGLAVCDLNQDGQPDLVIANNNGLAAGYLNRHKPASFQLTVHLKGKPGNSRAIGARVALVFTDGSNAVREVQAGSGYLSQSRVKPTFSYQASNPPVEVHVTWPDGLDSTQSIRPGETRVAVTYPQATN